MHEENSPLPVTLQPVDQRSQHSVFVPIKLKLPIVLQPEVIPTRYGCEVVVPILLKIPIALQIEVLPKPPACQVQPPQSVALLAESSPAPTEYLPEWVEPFTAAPLLHAPLLADPPIATAGQPQGVRLLGQKLSKLNTRLHHFYPITVLTLLLGTLLGTSWSSMLVKHSMAVNADRNCTIVSTTPTRLALNDRCF